MKLSQSFWQTYKEAPKDAEIPSHQLLMRAGLIHKMAAGLYSYLHFATRSLNKIKAIIREEHDKRGYQEILMNYVTPAELWQESGRWELYGPELLRIKDRADREMCLSPTNEETVTEIFRKIVKSYKQLPIVMYHINTKFRDEIRPRYGLMRAREFIMKDAYSFHGNKDCLDKVYDDIYNCYVEIFNRIGFDFISVEADGGAIADSAAKTHEFQVIADAGEDLIIHCHETGYSANLEKAQTKRGKLDFAINQVRKEISTPATSSIQDVCEILKVPAHQTLKSLVYTGIKGEKQQHVLVVLLGDDSLNEIKLKNYLNVDHLIPASESVLNELGLPAGFIAPFSQHPLLKVLFDKEISLDACYVVGAGRKDFHITGFVPKAELGHIDQVDLRVARLGDLTMDDHPIVIKKGIEVGHIFQLGEKYSRAMNAKVLNEKGQEIYPLMGCYGIGVTRILQAAIEASHDQNGIIWPKSIAPYHLYFCVIAKSDSFKQLAEEIYHELWQAGIETVLDDRGNGPGFMFKDADLLGLPLRLTLGERDYQQDQLLELKIRSTGESLKINREELINKIQQLWAQL